MSFEGKAQFVAQLFKVSNSMRKSASQIVSATLLQAPQFQQVLMAQCALQALALSQAQGNPAELVQMFNTERQKVLSSIEEFCNYLETKWNSDINRDLIQCIRSLEAEVEDLRLCLGDEMDQQELAAFLKNLWVESKGDTEQLRAELERLQTHGVKALPDGVMKFFFRRFMVELSPQGYFFEQIVT